MAVESVCGVRVETVRAFVSESFSPGFERGLLAQTTKPHTAVVSEGGERRLQRFWTDVNLANDS